MRSPLAEGEGLSHIEMMERYNVSFLCLAGSCRATPQCQAFSPIFLVTKVGGEHRESGFQLSETDVGNWKCAVRASTFSRA